MPFFLTIAKDQLFSMATLVEKALDSSLCALTTYNGVSARHVIENDKIINSYEINIDNATYNTLTLQQLPPETIRVSLSIQKINAILERIGDHAVNISESAITLCAPGHTKMLFEIPSMAAACKNIVSDAVSSFFHDNPELARDILTRDAIIDTMNISIGTEIKHAVQQGLLSFETAMELLRINKDLERIGDLSTNIAEETLFALTGNTVKHHNLPQEKTLINVLRGHI